MTTDLNIAGVRSLSHVMERTPNGNDAILLATKLGLWTASAHNSVTERPAFPRTFPDGASELSNMLASWSSEYGRIAELVGLLVGQQQYLKTHGKRLRASARAKARREQAEGEKALAISALNDLAEDDSAVLENDEKLALVELLFSQAQATKEATAQYLAAISREISYRDAQMKARLYGA